VSDYGHENRERSAQQQRELEEGKEEGSEEKA
jgi:hypothetical protein